MGRAGLDAEGVWGLADMALVLADEMAGLACEGPGRCSIGLIVVTLGSDFIRKAASLCATPVGWVVRVTGFGILDARSAPVKSDVSDPKSALAVRLGVCNPDGALSEVFCSV